jgi:hypothetical protein
MGLLNLSACCFKARQRAVSKQDLIATMAALAVAEIWMAWPL